MPAYLQINGPEMWAYQTPLDDEGAAPIGRLEKNAIVLTDPSVSGRHALVFRDGPRWKVQDDRSRNGTYVNGVQVREALLTDGDIIRVGQTEIRFHWIEENPEDDEHRTRTSRFFERQGQAIRGALEKAGPDQAVAVPTPVPIAPVGPLTPPPGMHEPTPLDPEADKAIAGLNADQESTVVPSGRDDLNWVAGQVAEILTDLAKLRGWTPRTVYERVLERLRVTIGAENGFLMIANRKEDRWVIRAWVGDPAEWTSYEKKHPVPLTIANQAFKENLVVSNALENPDGEGPSSESYMMLNVHCYIAVPLHRAGRKEGLLYFDTRRTFKTFAARDVRLLDRIGGYILQVEGPGG